MSSHRICPVEHAGSLDSKIRRLLQDPVKILGPYVKSGMTVLEIGCGPGFFSIDLARMVGESGKVIALDVQEGMLARLEKKIYGSGMEKRIELRKCEEAGLGVCERVDFALAFYVVHEMNDQDRFFSEIWSIIKPMGQLLMAEPKFPHVSRKQFAHTVDKARGVGFECVGEPKIFFSRSAVFRRGE